MQRGGLPDLNVLRLTECGLDHEGISYLTAAMKRGYFKRLTHLHLSQNPLGEQGLQLLGEGLGAGQCIQLSTLGLDNVELNDMGIRSLAVAFDNLSCVNLEELSLMQHSMGPEGLKILLQVLREGKCRALSLMMLGPSGPSEAIACIIEHIRKQGQACPRRKVDVFTDSLVPLYGMENEII